MNDPNGEPAVHEPAAERSASGLFLGLLAAALVASIGGLIWSYTLSSRLSKSEAALTAAQAQNDKLSAALDTTSAQLRVETEALSKSVGLTQKQLESRAQDLLRRQQADAKRLESEQAAASQAATQQIGAVSSQVSSVKSDVGGVKTDVEATKSELKSAEAQMQSMKGDLGVQSGLIATNHDELEILKHKGDRNIYEFTLNKDKKPQPVGTISLVLKKADPKKNRYTLVVVADDKQIEKKDRGANEPVQFYTGKDNLLFEVVVNSVNKNQVVGYLSTPKNAPKPVTP
jgi:multidrug efflux pump subunit AcrA (membrane-fusion protein)